MLRRALRLLAILTTLVLIAGPVGLAFQYMSHTRNFRPVREKVLYRSGQMSRTGLQRIIHDHGIRTVITLRDAPRPGMPPPDHQEEAYCHHMAMNYCRLTPRRWRSINGQPPDVEPNVSQFIRILSDPDNHPVLLHCFAGIHRVGAYVAIYRMEFEGWSSAAAIAELRANGYDNLDEHWDLLGYLERYEPGQRGYAKRGGRGSRDRMNRVTTTKTFPEPSGVTSRAAAAGAAPR